MLDILWNIVSFVLVLGLLVTAHEFGHYWVARRNGVIVKRFCIGFGKVIFSRHDKSGTEFAVAALPLGGYVMWTEEGELPESLKEHAYVNKPVLQRMAISFAGPAANFILAVLVLWLMYMVGQVEPKPIVGSVDPGSIIERAGIKPRDEIIKVNGQETLDWTGVNLAMVPSIGGDSMTIETINLDSKRQTSHVLDLKGENLDRQDQSIFRTLGLRPYRPKVSTEVAAVAKGSAAQAADLQVGDKIVKINDIVEPTWVQMVTVIQQNPAQLMRFVIEREGSRIEKEIVPQAVKRGGREVGVIGVTPVYHQWRDDELVHIQYGPVDALTRGVAKTYDLVKLSFVTIGKLFTQDVSIRNLSGPISIAQGAGYSLDAGFVKFLWFLALISVSLGVINLLPLPILDGGHLFYYTIELIRGKSVSERTQQIGFIFGATVLFCLMGIAMLNDITRLS